jgi:predicted GNAT superfamily acetyltransferase
MDPAAIEIRPLSTQSEFVDCVTLQRETWGETFSDVVPASILKVSQRIGGVAAGAFHPDGRLLGFVVGLTGVERGVIVHWSDMLAVRREARNLGLGRRLKEYQRQAVRELGGDIIYWTFDPLISRNAHLNFNRLGVRLAEYVEDMYGTTDSVLHGGMPTDRLIVAWPTDDREIGELLGESERTTQSRDCRQAPIATPEWISKTTGAAILPHCVRIEIPTEDESLFLETPAAAAGWRADVRHAMKWALAQGYTISGFFTDETARRGFYLFTKQPRAFRQASDVALSLAPPPVSRP